MSTLKADTIQSTSGGAATLTKQHAAKAWSSLDSGGGSTTTQHGSFNISSVLDDAVGQYGFNFTSFKSFHNFYFRWIVNCAICIKV